MSWDDFDEPTVEEIMNHPKADAFIRSHIKKYVCPECEHENIVAYSDGWNNRYTCNDSDCQHEFTYVG